MSLREVADFIIELIDVKKDYKETSGAIHTALRNITLRIRRGEFVIIVGPSGAGKTTLLNIMAGMDLPTEGQVIFDKRNFSDLSEEERTEIRRQKIGFIFQFFNLINSMTVLENVMAPLLPDENLSEKEIKERALEALSVVGLIEKSERMPNELSGGEQQRVAIARAIVIQPEVIFADEPIAQLDEENARKVITILTEYNRRKKATIILATASRELAENLKPYATKIIYIDRGKIVQYLERVGGGWRTVK